MDNMNNNINAPNDVLVYTLDYQNNGVLLSPINQSYALCWTDNYIIKLNNNIIINIQNQRKWNINSNF
jgi:hypothetical protein